MSSASNRPAPSFARPMLWALAVTAVVALAYGCWTAARNSADLERRAEEAELFRAGVDPYIDPDATYPPTAFPLFAAIIPRRRFLGRALWLTYNLAALGAIWAVVWRLREDWPRWTVFAFLLTATACKPARAGIGLGQFHLIPLAAILICEATSSRSPIRSGAFAALALMKPTMSLPFLFVLAAKRRWGTIGVAALVQASFFAGSSIWLGVGPMRLIRQWLDKARSQLAEGTIDVPSLIARAFPTWTAWSPIVTAMILAATGILVFVWRDRSAIALTALATFAAAVMTYHRHYDLVLLLPTLAYFIDGSIRRRRKFAGWMAGVLGAALIVPSYGRLVGRMAERAYEVGFVSLSYATLAFLLFEIAREANDNASGPKLA